MILRVARADGVIESISVSAFLVMSGDGTPAFAAMDMDGSIVRSDADEPAFKSVCASVGAVAPEVVR